MKAGEDFVVLDCDYDLENTSTKGLVVKWYLNELDLVYQWIVDTLPQAVSPALKYIDLRYKASNDKTKMYRAMKLKRPDIDLTGNYTCQISTFEKEVSEKRGMTVYCKYEYAMQILSSIMQEPSKFITPEFYTVRLQNNGKKRDDTITVRDNN